MDIMSVALAKAMMGGGSSGGGSFVVTVDTTIDESTPGAVFINATADKTAKEICEALAAGQIPVARVVGEAIDYGDISNVMVLCYALAEDDWYEVMFSGVNPQISPDGDEKIVSVTMTKLYMENDEDPDFACGTYTFPNEPANM